MQNKISENKKETGRQVQVLIVGGGISGLSAALFLLKQGITPLLVERHKSTSIHPRARGFDVRTMELYRELQLSEPIREAGKALAAAWGIHTGSSIAEVLKKIKPREGEGIKFPAQMKGMEVLAAQSPETGARCTQDLSEPVLLAAAKERGAAILFNTELISFNQDNNCVTAIIKNRETGEEESITADYMIAADGAKSKIREILKLEAVGKGALSDLLNIYFEADLADFVRGREFSIFRINEPGIIGMLTSINNANRWVFHLYYDTAKGESPEDFSEERIIAILEKVIGLPQINIRIISVLPWQPTIKVVTQMQHGRILLAGDAAHVMTPYGGKGANSGVQDVHNLAWKLAAVLNGKASPALLQTYSAERQPVGLHYATLSGEMANRYGLIKKVPLNMIRAFLLVKIISVLRLHKLFPQTAMRQLGGLFGLTEYKYSSTAIIDSGAQAPDFIRIGSFTAAPGTRVPHIWVEHNHQKISTLDLCGKDFVLFTGMDNEEWLKAAKNSSNQMKIELSVYSIGDKRDLIYKERSVENVFEISDTGAILIRPDGFVAWRCKEQAVNPSAELEKVFRTILFNSN